MKKINHLIAIVILLCTCSCTHRLTDFTVISTKNVPIGKSMSSIQKGDKRVKGVDKTHQILFIPLGMPNMKEAIDRAIESTPGAVGLVDGVVKQRSWTALVYGQNSYIVEGTPIFEADSEEVDYQKPKSRKVHKSNRNTTEEYYEPEPEPEQPASEQIYIFFHEVKDGETLAGIAKDYNVSVADIVKWNQLGSSNVRRGTKLKIQMH